VAEDVGKAYVNYYTHAAPTGSGHAQLLKRLYRTMKRGYLANKYGYRTGSEGVLIRGLGKLLYFFPVHRSLADAGIRSLRALPGGRLLDVGCGSGEWLRGMRELGWQVEGLDFDKEAVSAARQQGLTVHWGTLAAQRFPDACFDAVALHHVIEHVPDPLGLLKECRRILKPRGSLVLATPNNQSWGHRIFKEHWRGLEPPRHLHLMSPSAMRRFLTDAGFMEVAIKTYNDNYVFSHSYRLWRGRQPTSNIRSPISLIPGVMVIAEQILLLFDAGCGECIGAVALKE
jgi:2-polyprenyl-3-methyl-5-hydroxy-6-metoxy-1,4-benzoquinol methylase